MPRGGRRVGRQGVGYSQRTDLNQNRELPVRAAPSQQYGQAAAQSRSQEAVPMAAPPAQPPAPLVAPGGMGPLDRATERPDEPVTAGAPLGPGPGPEVLPQVGPSPIDVLRALYAADPNEDLRELLEDADDGVF